MTVRSDPSRRALTVDVTNEQADRLAELAATEERSSRAQLRVLIARYIAEHDEHTVRIAA
jgi:hypothetical protein